MSQSMNPWAIPGTSLGRHSSSATTSTRPSSARHPHSIPHSASTFLTSNHELGDFDCCDESHHPPKPRKEKIETVIKPGMFWFFNSIPGLRRPDAMEEPTRLRRRHKPARVLSAQGTSASTSSRHGRRQSSPPTPQHSRHATRISTPLEDVRIPLGGAPVIHNTQIRRDTATVDRAQTSTDAIDNQQSRGCLHDARPKGGHRSSARPTRVRQQNPDLLDRDIERTREDTRQDRDFGRERRDCFRPQRKVRGRSVVDAAAVQDTAPPDDRDCRLRGRQRLQDARDHISSSGGAPSFDGYISSDGDDDTPPRIRSNSLARPLPSLRRRSPHDGEDRSRVTASTKSITDSRPSTISPSPSPRVRREISNTPSRPRRIMSIPTRHPTSEAPPPPRAASRDPPVQRNIFVPGGIRRTTAGGQRAPPSTYISVEHLDEYPAPGRSAITHSRGRRSSQDERGLPPTDRILSPGSSTADGHRH